jgi:hypothetical protein
MCVNPDHLELLFGSYITQHSMKIHRCLLLQILSVSINEGVAAIPEKYKKHVKLLRKAEANEYSLNKEQNSYNDLLETLMLSCKMYKMN